MVYKHCYENATSYISNIYQNAILQKHLNIINCNVIYMKSVNNLDEYERDSVLKMPRQIKKSGDSYRIILRKDDIEQSGLKDGDWALVALYPKKKDNSVYTDHTKHVPAYDKSVADRLKEKKE